MQIVDVPWIQDPQGGDNNGYLLAALKSSPHNFKREAGRALGVVHLKVLSEFAINFPCSYMEMDVESSVCKFKRRIQEIKRLRQSKNSDSDELVS
ncbi:hypothetical protein MKX03_033051 [Papaver bracteatum]|nr:hypothetical protein MKX03_033051 [Papaver bracteatum]